VDQEKEIKKVRDEAAKYRTQLAPFKEAFGDLEPEAVTWMLDTIKMIESDPLESGKRFASVAYGNMGEIEFMDFIKTVAPNEDLVNELEIKDNEDMSVEDYDDDDSIDITEWAEGLEERLMARIDNIGKQQEEREANVMRQQQFDTINQEIKKLGYDPDSWQGKMLVQVASNETDQEQDIIVRLQEADGIVKTRIVQEEESVTNLDDNPLDVPATGGQIGGGGIPNIAGEEPITFQDANAALNELLKSQVGQ
tara:strand:+ start:5774 stop:6529 length:756 start_codon:yes stop_codon:yes gene_type:complete